MRASGIVAFALALASAAGAASSAGAVAALAARHGVAPRSVDIAEAKAALRTMGAVVP